MGKRGPKPTGKRKEYVARLAFDYPRLDEEFEAVHALTSPEVSPSQRTSLIGKWYQAWKESNSDS